MYIYVYMYTCINIYMSRLGKIISAARGANTASPLSPSVSYCRDVWGFQGAFHWSPLMVGDANPHIIHSRSLKGLNFYLSNLYLTISFKRLKDLCNFK